MSPKYYLIEMVRLTNLKLSAETGKKNEPTNNGVFLYTLMY